MSGNSSASNRYHSTVPTDRLRRSFAVTCIAIVCFVALLRGTGYTSDDIANHAEHVASNFGLQGHLQKFTDLAWSRKGDGSAKDVDKHRITLIVMWSDTYAATYLPALFRSAKHNANAVDLLWINVQRKKHKCLDITPDVAGATNIKSVCITDKENKDMIQQYFCSKWDCTLDQKAMVESQLNKIPDSIHVQYKPWRGMIYKEWIDTDWWAWLDLDSQFPANLPNHIESDTIMLPADADQVIGDFKSLWPWQSVDNFDVITISEWDYSNIYLRGQFTAFKLNEKLDNIWLEYPPLARPEKLYTLPCCVPDEFEYSVLYSNLLTNVNWMLIPRGLGADKFGRNKLVYHRGKAFYVPSDMRRMDIAMLFHPDYAIQPEPLFAAVREFDPKGCAVPARELRNGDYVDDKQLSRWCDQQETRCTAMREFYHWKSVLMRYNGQLLEYFDKRSRPRALSLDTYLGIEPKLMLHWQEIKRQAWFKLPQNGIDDLDILEVRGVWIAAFNKWTLETTFLAEAPGFTYHVPNDPLAMEYHTFNNSRALGLPAVIEQELLTAP